LGAGDLIIEADGGFAPKALPKTHNAPISAYGGGKLSTISGELPPILEKLDFKVDRHGALDTTGLPFCTQRQLVATDVAAARRACEDAIVGKGFGRVVVKLPEQDRITASTGLTAFNGPKVGGNDTIIVHAHLDVPAPSTVIVPIVIERIHDGVYGYHAEVNIPKLVNGFGHPVSGRLKFDRKWTYKGKTHSYLNARCETGRLQVRVEFTLQETFLVGTFFRPCTVRK